MNTQKTINIISKSFILLSALSLLSVSLMAFSNPQSVMDLVQVRLNNTDALSSIRGVYGGVGLTLVISLIYLMLKDVQKGLAFLCMLWGFYAASRIITICADGTLGAFGSQWLVIESLFFCIAAILLVLRKKYSDFKRQYKNIIVKPVHTALSIVLLVIAISSCKKHKNEALTYEVNNVTSVAEWKGSTPDHSHTGSFKVNGTFASNENGIIKYGHLVIPIASIENYGLPDLVKQQLLNHLKSPDFFNMALHPNAEFTITNVRPYAKTDTTAIGGSNYLITGNFTMLGETHSHSFPAKIIRTGDSITTEATFKIDRTKWGMKSYNDPNQGLYILPDVDIHLNINAALQHL